MIKNLKYGDNKGEKSMQPHRKNLHLAFMEGDKNEIRFKKVISVKSNF